MKIKFLKRSILLLIVVITGFSMCRTSDLRPDLLKKHGISAENTAKGKAILQEALAAMHYEKWAKHPTYQVIGSDVWYKRLGMNLSPWRGDNGAKLRLSYATNTFDSQVEWLSGATKGEILGIQSWQLYQQKADGQIEKIEKDAKLTFTLPTMQYFNELLPRLAAAPIVSYAGSLEEDGKTLDRVFCTWEKPEPNGNDQYLLYINPQNHRLEKVNYTIRDNFTWTPKSFYGTAIYTDYRAVDSVWIAHQLDVFPFGQTKKMKVHTFKIDSFKFNNVPLETLYPIPNLKKMVDAKQ